MGFIMHLAHGCEGKLTSKELKIEYFMFATTLSRMFLVLGKGGVSVNIWTIFSFATSSGQWQLTLYSI